MDSDKPKGIPMALADAGLVHPDGVLQIKVGRNEIVFGAEPSQGRPKNHRTAWERVWTWSFLQMLEKFARHDAQEGHALTEGKFPEIRGVWQSDLRLAPAAAVAAWCRHRP